MPASHPRVPQRLPPEPAFHLGEGTGTLVGWGLLTAAALLAHGPFQEWIENPTLAWLSGGAWGILLAYPSALAMGFALLPFPWLVRANLTATFLILGGGLFTLSRLLAHQWLAVPLDVGPLETLPLGWLVLATPWLILRGLAGWRVEFPHTPPGDAAVGWHLEDWFWYSLFAAFFLAILGAVESSWPFERRLAGLALAGAGMMALTPWVYAVLRARRPALWVLAAAILAGGAVGRSIWIGTGSARDASVGAAAGSLFFLAVGLPLVAVRQSSGRLLTRGESYPANEQTNEPDHAGESETP